MEVNRPIPGWKPSTPEVEEEPVGAFLTDWVAIHFWAEWNRYDPPLDRTIQQIAGQFTGRISFFSCNIDTNFGAQLAMRLNISTIPTLALVRLGEECRLVVGRRDPASLAEAIELLLAPPIKRPWWAFWK